jgi:hypothetical protein
MARSKVAEELREEQRRDVLAMTPDERIALAFAAGERDLEVLMAVSGLAEALGEVD